MAFSSGNKNPAVPDEQHEINVTPFIDVMLVLLIIFMVAAPLATVNVPVNLPAVTGEPTPQDEKPIYLTLQKDLSLTLGEETPVVRSALAETLKNQGVDVNKSILLRADTTVPYGDFIALMNQLAEAGYSKIALMGEEQVDQNP
ncbi:MULTISPECIES: biopolymer transporter ExbD [unclassified Pseudoalteromonas]|uniref:biopolymer transporter ExbD n=1 Tax=unclassified Pseudoalteromonas TaxID=194690 RepID=UPI002098597F|nr:biopolymer transporter ExbD [Pseudoalteromonas sp. XMcav2-N]MCO7188094.1 biopolymer transporter ExbD [Pseudoalteromonas sp. XMcav2-N]